MINVNRPLLLAIVLITILCTACKQETLPCEQPTTFFVNVACYHKLFLYDTSTAGVPFVDTFTYGYPLPNATLGYINKSGKAIPKYAIPVNDSLFTITLSPDSNTCQWFLNTDSLKPNFTDTFTFNYTRNLKFVSNACGYSYTYNLNTITYVQDTIPIDSVVIANPNVTGNINVTNVKIYFTH